MGQALMHKPPRYTHGFVDRHGKPRFYFRKAGFKRVALPGLPWSPEFMAAYEQAVAGQPATVGADRVRSGTMGAVALSYFASTEFRTLKPSTQQARRWIIEAFCREHGDKRAALLQREHVVKLIAARADQPGVANNLRKMLRALLRHAVDIGLRADDPTRDVKAIRIKSDGHHGWTDDEIAQFERYHPVGSRARLALALLLYTGQRRSDVIRMGAQHIRDGILSVKQEKTGAELAIPIHADLAKVISATPSGHLTFLTTRYGGPFMATPFSNWFGKECASAGLEHCSAHGLRKAAARRLAEAGCTTHEIAAITGHASLAELTRYTEAADQKRLAKSAMAKTGTAKTGTSSGKPAARFAKKGGKVFEIKGRKRA